MENETVGAMHKGVAHAAQTLVPLAQELGKLRGKRIADLTGAEKSRLEELYLAWQGAVERAGEPLFVALMNQGEPETEPTDPEKEPTAPIGPEPNLGHLSGQEEKPKTPKKPAKKPTKKATKKATKKKATKPARKKPASGKRR